MGAERFFLNLPEHHLLFGKSLPRTADFPRLVDEPKSAVDRPLDPPTLMEAWGGCSRDVLQVNTSGTPDVNLKMIPKMILLNVSAISRCVEHLDCLDQRRLLEVCDRET